MNANAVRSIEKRQIEDLKAEVAKVYRLLHETRRVLGLAKEFQEGVRVWCVRNPDLVDDEITRLLALRVGPEDLEP